MIKVTTDHRERVDRAWAKFREKKSNWEKELEKQENGEAAAAAPGGGASFVDVHKHNSGFVVV
ncbi:unnamed protein product [Amoebophrya sp. A25]|nr:unnamed protein product [Amoebophrya sp. A25]|eukprot:GSA25T00006600001.1